MIDKMTERLDFHAKGLALRAERQRLLASNIANADTPGYKSRDFNFAQAMQAATGEEGLARVLTRVSGGATADGRTTQRHLALPVVGGEGGSGVASMGYATTAQPSLDNNTVDLDRERASFVDNAVRYEATLRFINGNVRTMLSAIQGQ